VRGLEGIADDLLSDRSGDDVLRAAAARLYALCSSIAGIGDHSAGADDAGGTRLPGGEAIAPKDAARCVLDGRRTSGFLRGLHAAILQARARFPGTPVEILYAGCGPFAPLALPLTTRFGPAAIRFTLLDVHPQSLDAARRVFQALGKSAFVRDYVRCDAASYRHDAPHSIHVVVVEAMLAALEREPQAAITLNLAPQLFPGGIFLPERITVDCCLFDPVGDPAAAAGGGARIHLGRVLELTDAGCRVHSAYGDGDGDGDGDGGTSHTPKVRLHVPAELDGDFRVMLLTSINVFDSIALGEGESGLTTPRILFDLGRVHGGEVLEVEYPLSARPGFRYRFL
jgi:hypothetical protein